MARNADVSSVDDHNEIIYITDLSVGGDFDDYFDFLVMEKVAPDMTVVLDNCDGHQSQYNTSGIKLIDDYYTIKESRRGYEVVTGKKYPFNVGGTEESVTDDLINRINKSKTGVVLISVGSARQRRDVHGSAQSKVHCICQPDCHQRGTK